MRPHTWIVVVAMLAAAATSDYGAASAAEDTASLRVESEPAGAVVYVDGRLAGETPVTVGTIAAGVHRVRVVMPGYLENARLVTVKGGTRAAVRAQLTAAAPPLKIVVLEGEGAVNIIQQKTAVAPVVEVRDRNDQPVSGALVRFAIQKGKASFNGARTLTATTDALGRATATGLAPTGSGPVSIAASATFQGQTAAVAIVQTNVLTAAQAATAATAGTGGASAGGGGLSNFAIAGIVGGAGAGIGAVILAGKESRAGESSSNGNTNTGWAVFFTPSLDVSACNPAVPGGFGSQNLNVDSSGTFRDTWGNALGTAAANPVLEASGSMTATGLNGTLRCLATAVTGTISATPSAGDYLGTVTLGGNPVSIRVTRRQGP
jgi:hypothetical protein